jgi:type IV secretion system protein VirB8
MKKVTREALDAYYHEAGSWAEDRSDSLRASRRIAWLVAAIACVMALILAVVIIALLPLKTVVPYTLLVDRHTGYVQALKPVDAEKIAPDTALTQSFLVQYVVAREGFDINELQTNYRKVSLWSAGAARSDYTSSVQVSNPASPLASLPRSSIIDVQIKSVSSLGSNTALVRFDTQRRDTGGRVLPAQSWVSVIRYRYSDQPLELADRFINPLGFQVERYHRDQEALPTIVQETEDEPAVTATPQAVRLVPPVPPVPAQTRLRPVILGPATHLDGAASPLGPRINRSSGPSATGPSPVTKP